MKPTKMTPTEESRFRLEHPEAAEAIESTAQTFKIVELAFCEGLSIVTQIDTRVLLAAFDAATVAAIEVQSDPASVSDGESLRHKMVSVVMVALMVGMAQTGALTPPAAPVERDEDKPLHWRTAAAREKEKANA